MFQYSLSLWDPLTRRFLERNSTTEFLMDCLPEDCLFFSFFRYAISRCNWILLIGLPSVVIILYYLLLNFYSILTKSGCSSFLFHRWTCWLYSTGSSPICLCGRTPSWNISWPLCNRRCLQSPALVHNWARMHNRSALRSHGRFIGGDQFNSWSWVCPPP